MADSAFPTHPSLYSSADAAEAQGMSLRDYFAGQALIGMMAGRYGGKAEMLAPAAYKVADAMLDERERQP